VNDGGAWKRRYDRSLAEASIRGEGDESVGDVVAIEASAWLPGVFGAVALVIATISVVVRRALRAKRT